MLGIMLSFTSSLTSSLKTSTKRAVEVFTTHRASTIARAFSFRQPKASIGTMMASNQPPDPSGRRT